MGTVDQWERVVNNMNPVGDTPRQQERFEHVKDILARYKTLNTQNRELKTKNHELKDQNHDLKSEIRGLNHEVKDLESRLEQMEGIADNMQSQQYRADDDAVQGQTDRREVLYQAQDAIAAYQRAARKIRVIVKSSTKKVDGYQASAGTTACSAEQASAMVTDGEVPVKPDSEVLTAALGDWKKDLEKLNKFLEYMDDKHDRMETALPEDEYIQGDGDAFDDFLANLSD